MNAKKPQAPAPLQPLQVPLTGRHLIEASAGTGKTYTITTLVLRLVLERPLGIDELLVLTFTDAAAEELRDRIRTRLNDALEYLDGLSVGEPALVEALEASMKVAGIDAEATRWLLRGALARFDQAAISTFHSLCSRILQDHAFAAGAGYDVIELEDGAGLYEQVATDLLMSLLHDERPDLVAWLRSDVRGRNQKGDPLVGWARGLVGKAVAQVPSLLQPAMPDPIDPTEQVEAWNTLAARIAPDLEGIEQAANEWRAKKYLHGARAKPEQVRRKIDRLAAVLADRQAVGAKDRHEALKALGADAVDGWLVKAGKLAGLTPPAVMERVSDLLALEEAIEAAHAQWKYRLAHRIHAGAREVFERIKEARGVRVFDDLILQVHQGMERGLARALAGTYGAVLIDEFQDTDQVQYDIFKAVADAQEHPSLFLIGDPKQAIYKFRGADLPVYFKARADVQHQWMLARNWRSDRPLVQAVNRLFGDLPNAFAHPELSYEAVDAHHGSRLRRGDAPVVPLRFVIDGLDEDAEHTEDAWARRVAEDVHAVLQEGLRIVDGDGDRPLAPGDVAILIRGGVEGPRLRSELVGRGIPAVYKAKSKVFSTPEARELTTWMQAILRPRDLGLTKAVLAGPLMRWNASRLAAFDDDEASQQRWVERWIELGVLWERHGFLRVFHELVRGQQRLAPVLSEQGGERRITNLRHLAELVHVAEREHKLGPHGALQWLVAARQDDVGRGPSELRMETDLAAVQIVTMHSSKGLEYPVVFCPSLGKALKAKPDDDFHDDDGRRVVPMDADEASLQRVAEESFQEDIRLAYVALTRPRHLCVIHVDARDGVMASALAHLFDEVDVGLRMPGTRAPQGKKLRPALQEAARRVADRLEDLAEVRSVRPEVSGRYVPPVAHEEIRAHRTPERHHAPDHRLTSFSALSRTGPGHAPHDRAHGDEDHPSLPLLALPRGARLGTLVHEVLEHADFADVPSGRAMIEGLVRKAQLDVTDTTELLVHGLERVLRTPLDGAGFRLADLSHHDRLDEMAFMMPFGREGRPMSARALGRAFREQGASPWKQAYGERLQRFGFGANDGIVHGFVDLIYRHEGRYWVVDYKTNHLGQQPEDYRGERLREAMIDGDYVLQSHLYLTALHLFLQARLPGYSPEQHLGGIQYLFLRGMDPDAPLGQGVFTDTPSPALIDALADALGARTSGGTP